MLSENTLASKFSKEVIDSALIRTYILNILEISDPSIVAVLATLDTKAMIGLKTQWLKGEFEDKVRTLDSNIVVELLPIQYDYYPNYMKLTTKDGKLLVKELEELSSKCKGGVILTKDPSIHTDSWAESVSQKQKTPQSRTHQLL